jgi:carbonic anhydrase
MFVLLVSMAWAAYFSYSDNGDFWQITYPTCKLGNQSPINVQTAQTVSIPAMSLLQYGFVKYPPYTLHIVQNNPSTLEVTLDGTGELNF